MKLFFHKTLYYVSPTKHDNPQLLASQRGRIVPLQLQIDPNSSSVSLRGIELFLSRLGTGILTSRHCGIGVKRLSEPQFEVHQAPPLPPAPSQRCHECREEGLEGGDGHHQQGWIHQQGQQGQQPKQVAQAESSSTAPTASPSKETDRPSLLFD